MAYREGHKAGKAVEDAVKSINRTEESFLRDGFSIHPILSTFYYMFLQFCELYSVFPVYAL